LDRVGAVVAAWGVRGRGDGVARHAFDAADAAVS
jgi:hypothetical protein